MNLLFTSIALHLRYALILMLCIVILVLLSKWSGSGGAPVWIKEQLQKSSRGAESSNAPASATAAAAKQMQQARDWYDKALLAADKQTKLVYVTYALGYVDAALDLVGEETTALQQALGDEWDVDEFVHAVRTTQQSLTQ